VTLYATPWGKRDDKINNKEVMTTIEYPAGPPGGTGGKPKTEQRKETNMGEQLRDITIKDTPEGKIAVINGKTYAFLRGYRSSLLNNSWFWLAVAGKTPLRSDDLADKWLVTRAGEVYIAYMARPFSYFLLNDEPAPDQHWPKFKAPPAGYAFVGPTEEAAQEQLRMVMEQYRLSRSVDELLEARSVWVRDQAGGDVRALMISARLLY